MIREEANKEEVTVGICYKPLDWEDEVDEAFCKQLNIVIKLHVLLVLWDFNLSSTRWKHGGVQAIQEIHEVLWYIFFDMGSLWHC